MPPPGQGVGAAAGEREATGRGAEVDWGHGLANRE